MKRSFILPALLALSACSDGPDQYLARAKSEYAAQDFAAARADLGKGLKLDANNKAMLVLMARVQLRLGDGDGAQGAVDRLKALGMRGPELVRMEAEANLARGLAKQALDLLGSDPSADAWRIRAAARLTLGDSAGAMDAFKSGEAAGGSYLLALDYAHFLLANDDVPGAEAQLERMRGYDRDALATLMLAGEVNLKAGRSEEAQQAWTRAQQLYPKRTEPLLAQANALDIAGKVKDAVVLADKAATIAPDDPAVQALQIQFAGEVGNWEKVRKMLAPHEADLDPISGRGLAYAEALLRLGHPEQARAWFERAMVLSPNNPYSRLMAAQAQLATGDAATAYRTVRPLADSVLAGPRELGLAEQAARAAGDTASADAIHARLQSAGLKQAQGLSAQGQAALGRRDWPAAIAAYSSLAQIGPDGEVLKRLAYAQSFAGRHDEAIANADKAMALAPENPDMKHMAGLARLRAGRDLARARELLKAAADADPNSGLFKADLAKAQAAAG